MSSSDADRASERLREQMHRLGAILGPAPEDVVGIDIPRHQLRALFIVAKHGPLSVSALAEATQASVASTSSLVDRLVKAGYLERRPDPDDRRRVRLLATAEGQEVADKLMRRFRQRFEDLVEAMSPAGRAALETGLTDMLRAAEELGLHTAEPGDHPHDPDHHDHHEHGDQV